MRRPRRLSALLLCTALASLSTPTQRAVLAAQTSTVVRDSVAGSVSGFVRDTAGQPVRDALVYLSGQRLEARTRADGSYWLAVNSPGKYTLGARKVGYRGVSDQITADTGATRVDLELERLPEYLTAIVTTAIRGGLSGLVIDANGIPVPDAAVTAIGAGTGSRTNARGEFFIPVRSGRYLVRFEKAGLTRRLVSVTVPSNEGRRMVTTMLRQTGRANPREGANLFDLMGELIRASPVWQRLVTREDLLRIGARDAQQVAARFSASPVVNDECAKLDGGPSIAPLWSIDVQEIEFMVTTAAPPPTNIDGPFPCRHTVWLRR